MNCLSTQNFCSELHQPLLNSNFWHGHKGPFPFNKNSSLKFQKFHVPNGTVHSGCTDQTQATTHLVIVLVSRIQKNGTGDNNFVKWKGTFQYNWLKLPDWSKRTPFKAGLKYSGWTKPKWSVPFDVPTKMSGILGWMESAPDCNLFLVVNLLLSVFKKLFQC